MPQAGAFLVRSRHAVCPGQGQSRRCYWRNSAGPGCDMKGDPILAAFPRITSLEAGEKRSTMCLERAALTLGVRGVHPKSSTPVGVGTSRGGRRKTSGSDPLSGLNIRESGHGGVDHAQTLQAHHLHVGSSGLYSVHPPCVPSTCLRRVVPTTTLKSDEAFVSAK